MKDWIDYYDSSHSIYVSARHRDLHFQLIADHIAAYVTSPDAVVIDYSCGPAGFGHSEVNVLTPRSLRIATQGISDGLPFNYVLQAHRIADCPVAARH